MVYPRENGLLSVPTPVLLQRSSPFSPKHIHKLKRLSRQNYPWGKKGKESLSAVLCSKTPNTGFKIDETKEYAEMWMGDYPVLPAKDLKTGEELHKIVDENKEQLLGKTCIEKFGGVVPFLPKVTKLGFCFAWPVAAVQCEVDARLSDSLYCKGIAVADPPQ